MSASVLNQRVLILNKLWTAVGVASLQRAIVLLWSTYNDGMPKAKIIAAPGGDVVIDPTDEFVTYTWKDWDRMEPQDGESVVRSGKRAFKVPEVVLLTRYDKFPQQRVNFSRRTIYKRDGYKCQYCGCRPGTEELTIDHIQPKYLGGKTTWENCVLACTQCNAQKANRTPEDARRSKGQKNYDPETNIFGWKGSSPMVLMSVPKKPKFELFRGDRRRIPRSWNNFISEAYWATELQNENDLPDMIDKI